VLFNSAVTNEDGSDQAYARVTKGKSCKTRTSPSSVSFKQSHHSLTLSPSSVHSRNKPIYINNASQRLGSSLLRSRSVSSRGTGAISVDNNIPSYAHPEVKHHEAKSMFSKHARSIEQGTDPSQSLLSRLKALARVATEMNKPTQRHNPFLHYLPPNFTKYRPNDQSDPVHNIPQYPLAYLIPLHVNKFDDRVSSEGKKLNEFGVGDISMLVQKLPTKRGPNMCISECMKNSENDEDTMTFVRCRYVCN